MTKVIFDAANLVAFLVSVIRLKYKSSLKFQTLLILIKIEVKLFRMLKIPTPNPNINKF
jgi:hypothetical protein